MSAIYCSQTGVWFCSLANALSSRQNQKARTCFRKGKKWQPLEVAKADAGPKAVLVKAARDVVLQLVQHIPVHCLDLGPPLAAAAQRSLLQETQQCVFNGLGGTLV